MSCRPGTSTATLLLPLLSLVACGGGGEGVATREGTAASVQTEPEPVAVGAPDSDLHGLTIRRVGLARFDVVRVVREIVIDSDDEDEIDVGFPEGDHTEVEVAFTALDEPLDDATLARIAAMPGAGASGSCYPVESDGARSIGALFESAGSPLFAGEVLTVSRVAGSWFELWGVDDEPGVPFYEMSADRLSYFGIEGHVEAGTTIDVPGDAFPAFAAVEVPAMASLSDVVEGEAEVRWRAGADPDVPMVIDVRFLDYVTLRPSASGTQGDLLISDEFGASIDWDIHPLVEAPVDMRCVTRDSGRFVYPDALRATIERFGEAGQAVADQILAGSDLEAGTGAGIGPDGDLTDSEEIYVSQGRVIGVSRVATRYRVEGDALLIVQSSNGGTL